MRRIALISSASPGGNEWRIVRNLHRVLQRTQSVQLVDAAFSKTSLRESVTAFFTQIRTASSADIVVIHSPFISNFPAAIMAWLLRRRLIAFIWDSYPSLIAGKLFDRRPVRRLYDLVEILVLRLVSRKIVQTSDFFIDKNFIGAEVIPFWTGLDEPSSAPVAVRAAGAPMSIVFAGHIDETRGVAQALHHLDRILQGRAEVHLFSRDSAKDLLAPKYRNITVRHHGFLPRSELSARMERFDFGLIALHPELDVPGFPSKTLDYLSASLPVLYCGRPLPAFTDILEKSGAGVVISDLSTLNLAQLARRFNDMVEARRSFEDMINAKVGAFDHLFKDDV